MQEQEESKIKISDIEKQRLAMRAKVKSEYAWIIATAILAVIALICFYILNPKNFATLIFFIIGIGVITYSSIQKAKSPFEAKLRVALGNMIMTKLQPDWSYTPDKHIATEHFAHLNITRRFDIIHGEHLTEGRHGETDFVYSFVDLLVKGQKGRTSSVFKGMILVADFHKNITGRTVVFPDSAQLSLGTWLGKKVQELGWKNLDLVYLEDPVFEKEFVVYSHDQIEARYILTPSMMERLITLNKSFHGRLAFVFNQNKVYIAIKDLPAPSIDLDLPISSRYGIQPFNRSLNLVKEIIDVMELNTRIWEKE